MKLPKTLYVRIADEGRDPYFVAAASVADTIDDDGPSTIGVYQLAETLEAAKTVVVTKPKGRHIARRSVVSLLLLLLLPLAPVAARAETPEYDPIAILLTPAAIWTTEAGAMGLLHVLVAVPGPGDYDLALRLPPDSPCPPKEVIKRKLPRWAVADDGARLLPIQASIQSLGWHPGDGFTRLRVTHWGAAAVQYHVVVYYCQPSGHGRH